MLAEALVQSLGLRAVDRETIVARAAESGVSQHELLAALLKPPSLLDRFQHKKYLYLTLFQAALAEEVRSGGIVYHGNAGHLMLRAAPPVLRVRIVAPMEVRIAMARQRMCLDHDQARAYIEEVDRGRRKWTQFLYGVDWTDPALYDFVLNLEIMNIQEACEVVGAAARQKRYELTTRWQAAMNDFALASRVRAALSLNRRTAHLRPEVEARGGRVTIQGKLVRIEEMEEIRQIALQVPGVVEYSGRLMPPLPS